MENFGVIAFAVVIALTIIIIFNTMIGRKNRVQFAFAGIDAQLKKRFDLIPNLISSVERYMKHESEVLVKLTSLRANAVSGTANTDDLVKMDKQLTSTLRTVFAMAENYPQLQASANFLQLQGSLNETEEQIAAARRAFNAAVTEYNNGCEMFPLTIAARMMGYKTKLWFEASESERKSVNVKEMWS
jgi:LemA protein